MLLCHALALQERGIPLYADVLPFEGEARLNLAVAAIDQDEVAIDDIEASPILHKCKPGSPLEGLETPAGRIRLHLCGDDPASALLATGMKEVELNHMVIEAMREAREMTR